MTDRGGQKDKNNNTISNTKLNSNEASHKKEQSRPHEDNSSNDTFTKRYKVIEKIGEGSYSEVLKCQSRLDGSTVACKRLKHTYRSLDDVTNISEIATLRTIQKHSNILQMLEIHYDKTLGKVSLVFELMEINLYELIKDRKRLLPESRVRTIMFQLFRALRHLHKLGVFHRDIKPENILIRTKTDQLKLGDLGSVRGMFSRAPYTEYISTRWYRSPECLLTAGHYSHKMDIWAAGCVFYEVLTLRPLFPGSSEIDQINRINNVLGPPPIRLLDTFQKQAEMERDTYRGQSQLNRRQQIQKILNSYSSRYLAVSENKVNYSSNNSLKNFRREFHFTGKEGTGLEKILPAHITREAKEIIKNCLLYDPEQRPTANRVVQLSYFSELRDSYSKNPEKVSSKTVVLICDETVTNHSAPIELGTLGDHKVRYKRGVAQRPAETVASFKKTNSYKVSVEKISSSGSKQTDVNNNYNLVQKSSSSNDNLPVLTGKPSSNKISVIKAKISEKTSTTLSKSKESLLKKSSSTKIPGSIHSETKEKRPKEAVAQQSVMKLDRLSSKSNSIKSQNQKISEVVRKQEVFSSSSSEDVPERKYRFQKEAKEPRKAGSVNAERVSPYMKPPRELTFLRNKIKIDKGQNTRKKGSKSPHPQQTQTNPYLSSGQHSTKVSVVPPKVAAAAIKYVKGNGRRPILSLLDSSTATEQSESNPAMGVHTGRKGRDAVISDMNDDTTSYATNSSIKIGKLRFRQSNNPPKEQANVSPLLRSKIPVVTEEIPQSSRRSTKLITSPPSERREAETTDKWRNTGVPRRIPMSPERERNIKLLKDSLTMDKNKRVKLKCQDQADADRNKSTQKTGSVENLSSGGLNDRKLTDKYDYTSHDTMQSTGEQRQTAGFSSGGGPARYRHTTTEYENPDFPDTSSASGQALETQQRNLFNASRQGRIVNPPSGDIMSKKSMESASTSKNSGDLYPPEMINLYSSRYRGPNINMSILKDSGNTYGKRGSNESTSARPVAVKDKINLKLEQRKRNDNVSPVKQDASSKFNPLYNTVKQIGAGEEEVFSRAAVLAGRKPPLPPTVMSSSKHSLHNRTLGEPTHEERQSYNSHRKEIRRPEPTPKSESTRHSLTKDVPSGDQLRKQLKENIRKKEERLLRRTMRDDVFCSSDDDVVISMRKKFDNLISERARKLSESLKVSNTISQSSLSYSNDSSISKNGRSGRPPGKYTDSNSDDEQLINSITKSRNSEKSRKYARRELRARMAESLTMANGEKWGREGGVLDRVSNESGDWVDPLKNYTDAKKNVGDVLSSGKSSYASYNASSTWSRGMDNDFREATQLEPLKRLHPFPDMKAYNGQIFNPPSNKPSYPQTSHGGLLQDRKLRYSHNTPLSLSGSYLDTGGPSSRRDSLKQSENLKKRHL